MSRAKSALIRQVWIVAGGLALLLGILGIALPLLPTTPLILLAAFCFGKGSERLRNWLTSHSKFGPMIADWESHGAISKRGKIAAVLAMGAAFALSIFLQVPGYILLIQVICLGGAATFVLSRPTAAKR